MSYLATVASKRAWILDPTDPFGYAIVCGTRDSGGSSTAVDGEIVHYAGGWIGSAVYSQDDTGRSITLARLTLSDVEQLKLWRGRTLLFRFTEGERIFAVFFGFTFDGTYAPPIKSGSTST
jgi:hypothetical protein